MGGCKKRWYKGAGMRPAGHPNPPATNRRQNDGSAWNSGPKWIRGDNAARVCDAWYFALMGRREAGLLVIIRRLHLRYAVTRGLVCATKPSPPPRVTLTLYRPFRTILHTKDC